MPRTLKSLPKQQELTLYERRQIIGMQNAGMSIRKIGDTLNIPHGTIIRQGHNGTKGNTSAQVRTQLHLASYSNYEAPPPTYRHPPRNASIA